MQEQTSQHVFKGQVFAAYAIKEVPKRLMGELRSSCLGSHCGNKTEYVAP